MNSSLTAVKFRVGMTGFTTLLIGGLVLMALLSTVARADDAPPAKPAPAARKPSLDNLVYRFDPIVFTTTQFPTGSFQQDDKVKAALGPIKVETTFYNEKYDEVKEAATTGRYGAVVHATFGDGAKKTFFVTLFRAPEGVKMQSLGQKLQVPVIPGSTPEAKLAQQDAITTVLKDAMGNEGFQPKIATLLPALAMVAPGTSPMTLLFTARDDAWWFDLRKKIGESETYPFLIELPEGYEADPAKHWPLILYLHGSGERGSFINNIKRDGLPKLIGAGHKFPAIVISPQCPANEHWSVQVLSALIDDISTKDRVDADRIMVTGMSMGGVGTWAMATTYPDRFSAIAPICGIADPADGPKLTKLPTWVFHGQLDQTVPVQMSQLMVAAIRQAGGKPHLTIYPDAKHDSWTKAYDTDALFTWMLAQERGKPEVKTPGMQE